MRNLALAFCGGMLFNSTPMHAQLVVDRLDMAITPIAGKRVVGNILVTNEGDAPVQASISREEWDRAENGENRFLPIGATGASCGEQLSVSPAMLRLEPHTSERLRVTMNGTPANAKECWDVVYIEQLMNQAPVRGNSLTYRFRTAVKIYVVPDGLSRDAAIENMQVESASRAPANSQPSTALPNAPHRVLINFRNTGGMHLLAKGRMEVRRLDNSIAADVPIPEFPVLPGALRKLSLGIPNVLEPGDYVVLAMIDFGGSEIAAGQVELRLK